MRSAPIVLVLALGPGLLAPLPAAAAALLVPADWRSMNTCCTGMVCPTVELPGPVAPGSEVSLDLSLVNVGDQDVTAALATLIPLGGPLAPLGGGPQDLPAPIVAGGPPVTGRFGVRVDPAAACPAVTTVLLRVTSPQGDFDLAYYVDLTRCRDCSCDSLRIAPIAAVQAARDLATSGLTMRWRDDLAASEFDVWRVTRKEDLPFARRGGGPEQPVTGCHQSETPDCRAPAGPAIALELINVIGACRGREASN